MLFATILQQRMQKLSLEKMIELPFSIHKSDMILETSVLNGKKEYNNQKMQFD
jgi:hypothetical protein